MKRKPFIYAGRGIVARLNEGLHPIDTDLEKYIEAFRSVPKESHRKVVLLKKRKR